MDSENNIFIFYTPTILEHAENPTEWLSDGTYLTALQDYMQEYVIYEKIYKNTVTCIYILMKTKQELHYNTVFNFISKQLKNGGPKNIIIEIEKAANNGFSKIFFAAKIYNCLTHYSNKIYQNLVKFNLGFEYAKIINLNAIFTF